ncbi:MAG: NAD(P)H-dependent oxidoreductase [Anaerolineae bacterium]|nr:NAD(P)H-dependent oxidoreductase [Gloeobacterales cyanobacterium ES-bin-313]
MAVSKPIKIFAISGSLRATSLNTALLRAAMQLVAPDIEITLYGGLGALPHFNPDLEVEVLSAVTEYRTLLQNSDGILISSPEYAHGIPGVMKNALDWVVGSGEFVKKPVAILNGSPRATYAQASLVEILTTMDAHIVEEASITLPLLGSGLDQVSIAAHCEFAGALQSAMAAFADEIQKLKAAIL